MSSIAADRDAIVAALAGVTGLAASPVTPAPVVAGSAWPVWLELSWVTGSQTLNIWQVFVALPNPNGQATAEKADEVLAAVAAVLWPLGKIRLVEPMAWPVEAGQQAIPVLRFSLEI